MALTITSQLIRSTRTPHTAEHHGDNWLVSWLPGRTLSHSQAVSALTIAQAAGSGLQPADRRWPHIDGWAAELGLDGPDAVRQARCPPDDA